MKTYSSIAWSSSAIPARKTRSRLCQMSMRMGIMRAAVRYCDSVSFCL